MKKHNNNNKMIIYRAANNSGNEPRPCGAQEMAPDIILHQFIFQHSFLCVIIGRQFRSVYNRIPHNIRSSSRPIRFQPSNIYTCI